MTDSAFELDARLQEDTRPLARLDVGELLLMDDARWPWLILVPRVPGATELHHLPEPLRADVLSTWVRLGESIEASTGCRSVNLAALGNAVAQLHLHVVARTPGDPNWPRPVWGFESRTPYPTDAMPDFATQAIEALAAR